MARAKLMVVAEPRRVAFVSTMLHVKGCGYRVSIVVDGENGHRPTGDWPDDGKDHSNDMPGDQRPWFWGRTFDDAQRACESYNERNGIAKLDAALIVARSMVAARTRR